MAPLPATTVRLAQMVSDPDCHLDDVAELVAFDQALTVRLLRGANSAANAAAAPMTTAQDAVFRLGAARVLSLAVAAGAKPLLQAPVPACGLNESALWRHSVAAAVAEEAAAGFCRIPAPPEAFTAALLHDIGKLIMGRFLNPEILGYLRRVREPDGLEPLDAESLLLGIHHGELGGLIVQLANNNRLWAIGYWLLAIAQARTRRSPLPHTDNLGMLRPSRIRKMPFATRRGIC